MTHKLRITATLVLDEFSWVRNDITAQEWMLNQIILGDDLRVFSPEIGDEVGILLVHHVEDMTQMQRELLDRSAHGIDMNRCYITGCPCGRPKFERQTDD